MINVTLVQERVAALAHYRHKVVCTRCGKRIVNGDCGTAHPWGSAQMMIVRDYRYP